MNKTIETSKGRFVVCDKTDNSFLGLIFKHEPIKLSEITEEDASSIIEETIMYQRLKSYTYKYRSYINGFLGFDTALDSLHSLLESQGTEITQNTYIFKV